MFVGKDTPKPPTKSSTTSGTLGICSKMGSCANSTCPSGTICDITSLKCVCGESCDATCNCPNDTICSSGQCVELRKEVYFYDKGRYFFPQIVIFLTLFKKILQISKQTKQLLNP